MGKKILGLLLAVFLMGFVGLPKAQAQTTIPVLMYHYIGNNPNPKDTARDTLSVVPDKFDAEMGYLAKNGYTPISLDTMYGILNHQVSSPAKPIVLTFDDGYVDFFYNAYPILRKYNFHAVSFIPTGLMGTAYYMNWDQIKQIQSSGLVTFEDHSVTHANLVSLSFDAAYKQMLDAKNVLQAHTGYPVNFVAYPFGTANGNVIAAAQKAGLIGGMGTWYGKVTWNSMNMPRIRITGQMNLAQFASAI